MQLSSLFLSLHQDGDTPLLCGCWHGYRRVVECLARSGCLLQLANNEGETALHVAAVRGNHGIVQFLVENGVNLNATDNNGCSALHLATRRNNLDIVQYLCQKGVNVNLQDCNGDTAMHDACRQGQLSLFHTLYAANNDLDIANTNGATPLHLAAKYGHSELVRCLCSAGCDLEAVTEHGFTADEVAANSGHDTLATLIHHLRQGGLREYYVSELVQGQCSLDRAKLLVCGGPGVGKTELINSLKCNVLRSLFRRRSNSNFQQMILRRTHGMSVQQGTIPNVGLFSIWDFSGLKEFYVSHENFLGGSNSVFLLVCSLRDSVGKQLAQMRFWLAMIKARTRPGEIATRPVPRRPFVVLVGSFADQQNPMQGRGSLHDDDEDDVFAVPHPPSAWCPLDNGRSVLEKLSQEFGDSFDFSNTVFAVDCRLSQSAEMRSLRSLLRSLHTSIIKEQPLVPKLVYTLCQSLPGWRREHEDLPALSWTNFHAKTRDLVNPLVSEEVMKSVASALHDMGEIIFINKGLLTNLVILDPAWLGRDILGPALTPDKSLRPHLNDKSVTGRVTLSDMQSLYGDLDSVSVARIFQHFELCSCSEETTYEFPCLMRMEPLYGLWVKDPNFSIYAGLYLECCDTTDLFSPGLFPRLQVLARKGFGDDVNERELTLWTDGLKCSQGDVEALVEMKDPNKRISIVVRGGETAGHECRSMLQQFYQLVLDTVQAYNPGTRTTVSLLSPRHLGEHVKNPVAYSAVQIFDAEREGGKLRDEEHGGPEESVLDVVCCGCEDLLITARSAPYTLWRDVSQQSRAQVCRMLDPDHPFGRDWCLLALQLGLTEEVATIDQSHDGRSSTDKLLGTWDRLENGTIVNIVDGLRGIGRGDVASVVINGISPFSNPDSSVVINLPCVTLTSYVC
jgi:death-associated protein kinase